MRWRWMRWMRMWGMIQSPWRGDCKCSILLILSDNGLIRVPPTAPANKDLADDPTIIIQQSTWAKGLTATKRMLFTWEGGYHHLAYILNMYLEYCGRVLIMHQKVPTFEKAVANKQLLAKSAYRSLDCSLNGRPFCYWQSILFVNFEYPLLYTKYIH